MSEHDKAFYAGVIFIAIGVGTILFGGTTETGRSIEIFGFRFGTEERRQMGRFESWFWGALMVFIGVLILG